MILRICAIEWRGKIDDPRWRGWADVGIAARVVAARRAVGRRVRGIWCAACRSTPTSRSHLVDRRCAQRLHAARRAGHRGLFAFYGAVFIALKTAGAVRDDAFRFARLAGAPGHRAGGRLRAVDAAGARQGLDLVGARRRGGRAAERP